VLADKWLTTAAEEAAEDERDDHDVVELTGDRDEVRHEIEGEREVAREGNEQRLLPARHARVAEQPAAEDDAVWDETSESPGAFAPASDDESEDERGIEEQKGADPYQRPGEGVHLMRGYFGPGGEPNAKRFPRPGPRFTLRLDFVKG
jgi:hypothetical protein